MKATSTLKILLPFLSFTACTIIDPGITVPSYIHMDSIHLNVPPTTLSFETNSTKITDAWIYVNDQFIGTFQLPATIPVLSSGSSPGGSTTVSVDAGIEVNGISANRAQYPFYKQFSSNLNLVKGKKITLEPTVTYLTPQPVWYEGFEGGVGFSIKNDPNVTDTSMPSMHLVNRFTNPANVFQGNGSGAVFLDNNHLFYSGISSVLPFKLSANSDSVSYLELNYKTNNNFVVGLYSTLDLSVPVLALTINPSASWNKIYVNLTTAIAAATALSPSTPTTFKVYFFMAKDSAVANPALYLDNIQLVHF
jgi:hypothetical protein